MKNFIWLFLTMFGLVAAVSGHAQGTAFTYQGRLNSGGNPANGSFDLAFTLFTTNTTGTALAGPVTNSAVAVTNGLFTTLVDFGAGIFTGGSNWLAVAVRTNGTGSFTNLTPRQQLTPVPYAIVAGSASNLLGVLPSSQLSGTVPASQLSGALSLTQLPTSVVTNGENPVSLQGSFGGTIHGYLADLNTQFPTTLSNLNSQVATPLNLGGGTNFSAAQLAGGTWTNAALTYTYKSFFTNYTITTTDVVLDCTGTNQVVTLLPAANFPPSTLLTIWSDNVNGSVIITNATGNEAITVAGQGQGLAVVLGPANSPSNSVTLMVHGGHW